MLGLNSPRTTASKRRAFSLIELLVSLFIAALLCGILIMSLRGSRGSARRAAALAELRQHVSMFAQYGGDYADLAPSFTSPSIETRLECCGRIVQYVKYFEAHNSWNIALVDRYPGANFQHDFFFASNPLPADHRLFTEYWYSSTFLADSSFWNNVTRIGPSQWKPQRLTDATRPSLKGLFIAFEGLENEKGVDGALIGFVDGSAQRYPVSKLKAGYASGPGPWALSDGLRSGLPVMHTVDGIRGVDIETR